MFNELWVDVPVTDGNAKPISLPLFFSHNHTGDALHVGTAGTCGLVANQSQEQLNVLFVCVCEETMACIKLTNRKPSLTVLVAMPFLIFSAIIPIMKILEDNRLRYLQAKETH